MATVLLHDLMETRYIIDALAMRFRRSLDTALSEGSDVDLAECRFGPLCSSILNEYYGKLRFINSEDSYLNDLLANNVAYKTEPIEEYETLTLRGITEIDTYMQLVKDLPQGARYKVDCSLSSLADKATLVLLLMTRPDLELDIRQCASDIYDFVRDTWIAVAEHHSKYYELIAPDTVIVEEQENGYFGSPAYGYQKEQTFIKNRKVLPFEFGNTQIVTLDNSVQISNEWRTTAEKCISAFEHRRERRASGKVLRNLLTFREDG